MKKLFATFIALALAASMSMTAFAGEATGKKTTESQDIEVTAKYSETTDTVHVYSVDIKWDDMTFTWQTGGTKTWNPNTHEYELSNSTKGFVGGTGRDITVTNHSDLPVTATFSFTVEDDFKGKFLKDKKLYEKYDMSLDAGVENAYDNADSDTVTFKLQSWPNDWSTVPTTGKKIGTIKVTIS